MASVSRVGKPDRRVNVNDRWWDEDKHYLKHPSIGPVFAMLTNAALSVLRLVQQSSDPLTKTAENFHYSPRKARQLLGFDEK